MNVSDDADVPPGGPDVNGPPRPSADPDVLAGLHAQAAAADFGFVDPHVLATRPISHLPQQWAAAILGRPVATLGTGVSWREHLLLLVAADTDAAWLDWQRRQQRELAARQERERAERSARQQQRRQQAWQQIRDALPVPVRVRHNWTLRHHDGYVNGADHIVTTEPLQAGRLTRQRWQALCQTPSREHDLRGLDRDPNSDYAQDRVPTCAACLRLACRLTGLPAPDDEQ